MEEKKKAVALSDDALDMVSGGLIVNPKDVVNQETGEVFPLLTQDRIAVFMFLTQLGAVDEQTRINALREAGYIA